MSDFSKPLGDAVKRARGRLGMTQSQVADAIDIDARTVMNIENYKGNPKLEVLYPLIRTLQIDPREIFNPEMSRDNPAIVQLRAIVEQCTEQEAETIVPIMRALLSALHDNRAIDIVK